MHQGFVGEFLLLSCGGRSLSAVHFLLHLGFVEI